MARPDESQFVEPRNKSSHVDRRAGFRRDGCSNPQKLRHRKVAAPTNEAGDARSARKEEASDRLPLIPQVGPRIDGFLAAVFAGE
jgi:hypothetical protein